MTNLPKRAHSYNASVSLSINTRPQLKPGKIMTASVCVLSHHGFGLLQDFKINRNCPMLVQALPVKQQ
jgi:hypothetical protein